MKNVRVWEILQILKENGIEFRFSDKQDVVITNAKSIDDIEDGSIGFYGKNDIGIVQHGFSAKNLVLLQHTVQRGNLPCDGNYIFVENPRLSFILIVRELLEKSDPVIHSTAIIHRCAKIGKNCSIGAFAFIDEHVSIGDNVTIGEHCILKNNVTIGNNVTIRSGTILGNPGLGSEKDKYGKYHDFPHLGDILIEDNVSMGDHIVVHRGTLNTTVIGKGTIMIANIWVGHGVQVGKTCFVGAGVQICGSVRIGDNSWLSPGVVIRDRRKIGANVTVGMGAVVTKDIPSHETWFGVPAEPKETFMRSRKK